MFEVCEEKINELESNYEVPKERILDYATMLGNCSLIQDEETYDKMLEHSISMLSSLPTRILSKEAMYRRTIRKEVLTKSLTDVLINCPDNEVDIEVETMLKSIENERKK